MCAPRARAVLSRSITNIHEPSPRTKPSRLLVKGREPHSGWAFLDVLSVAKQPARFIALRMTKRFAEARAMSSALWASSDGDAREHIERNVRAQYRVMFAAMPASAALDYGNVVMPRVW